MFLSTGTTKPITSSSLISGSFPSNLGNSPESLLLEKHQNSLRGRSSLAKLITVVNTDWSTDVLDIEQLAGKEGHADMLKLTEIALECTDIAPKNQPKMGQVLRRIEEIDGVIQERECVKNKMTSSMMLSGPVFSWKIQK
ncbi:unnamed protein product [Ilex paraguariensis]|uniref:Uncharacterized protein n=1 Tax=Ilex paraguariensis TaxID=185542 RepID=A0ABC8T4P3_9AQUA